MEDRPDGLADQDSAVEEDSPVVALVAVAAEAGSPSQINLRIKINSIEFLATHSHLPQDVCADKGSVPPEHAYLR